MLAQNQFFFYLFYRTLNVGKVAKFRKKPIVVEARRLTEPTTVEERGAVLQGCVGEWLVVGLDGKPYLLTDRLFRQTYYPVDAEARRMFKATYKQ